MPEPQIQDGTSIALRVEHLSQLFNSLDPYPFQEKDLDKEAEEYIVGWARELKPDEPVTIMVHLPAEGADTDDARSLGQAFENFFDYRAERILFDLRELFRVGRMALVIGLAALAISLVAAHQIEGRLGDNQFARIATESLVIVGWVANWRPLEIFLYEWWPIRRRYKLYRRLARAKVVLRPR